MKNKILLYLFLFTALILIFQLVNSKKVFNDMNSKIVTYKKEIIILKDSISQLGTLLEDERYFNLIGNEDAMRYFNSIEIDNISGWVKDELYETNLLREKNDLIPYEGMNRTFLINKVKVLNHKWLTADFSDGMHWGEIFLGYKILPNSKVTFELKEHLLYPISD